MKVFKVVKAHLLICLHCAFQNIEYSGFQNLKILKILDLIYKQLSCITTSNGIVQYVN